MAARLITIQSVMCHSVHSMQVWLQREGGHTIVARTPCCCRLPFASEKLPTIKPICLWIPVTEFGSGCSVCCKPILSTEVSELNGLHREIDSDLPDICKVGDMLDLAYMSLQN